MIPTDPGSRSLGSDPGIRFRDPRTCLIDRHYDVLRSIYYIDLRSDFELDFSGSSYGCSDLS